KEAALAWQLEQKWSKDKILTAYLNTIYFGNGAYGIERAARTYFGHSALKLTLAQSALLAGIPEDPSLYDPVAHPRTARARRSRARKTSTSPASWASRRTSASTSSSSCSPTSGSAPSASSAAASGSTR